MNMATKKRERYFGLDRPAQGDPPVSPGMVRQRNQERALAWALSIPIEQIEADPEQPRKVEDPEDLQALAASLSEHGVLQPILVRDTDTLLDDGRPRYKIIAGERRYKAGLMAGLTRMPAVVSQTVAAETRVLQFLENMLRTDLEPIDEARAIRELMDLEHIDAQQVARRLHKSHTYVDNRLLLLKYTLVADAVSAGKLSLTPAVHVARGTAAVRREVLRQAEQKPVRVRDVARIRRKHEHAQPEAAGGIPIQQTVMADLGASAARAADAAEKTGSGEPDSLPIDAPTLAMPSIPAGVAERSNPFAVLVEQANGKGAVLALLTYMRAQRWTVEQCELALTQLPDEG
jgi:ParB family chromosome partitioning protein